MGLLSGWSARQLAQSLKDGVALGSRAAEGLRAGEVREDEPPETEGPPSGVIDPAGLDQGRMRWDHICRCREYRGRWVALDACRYDEASGRATEGEVVDADDDLVELCSRMRMSDRKNCAILFAGED